MLTTPYEMAAWDPYDVTSWSAGLDDDPEVTDTEYAQARRAVTVALLGETTAADIHGPAA